MELELWQVVVLAVVQGLTEFLPISSDGHLTIATALMVPDSSAESLDVSDVVIMLHGGTLLSILVFYWHRIRGLLREDRRALGLLLVATIPALVFGLPAKLFAEAWLTDPQLAGVFLIVTGLILIAATRIAPGNRDLSQLTPRDALLIGCSQAAAILPGLSRSGCTIATGLGLRLQPRAAATFSFLLAIPVIFAACSYEVAMVLRDGQLSTPLSHLALGIGVAFLVGLLALTWLVKWLERGRFASFAWWCIPVGVAVLVWQRFFAH